MDKTTFYANARNDRSGPLDGIIVIEATTTWAGPMAGCVLADLGATVIKCEHPDGEIARRLPPAVPDSELSIFNETVNRNKKSLTLRLKEPQGREVFLDLCKNADIVVENFKPGTLQNWGCGYLDVAQIKPDIIYVSVSGFGQFGPLSERAGYDPIAQNFTGWSSLNGEPDGGPVKAPTYLADDLGGVHGAIGALAALQHRNATGEGQHVDVSLVDSLLFQSNGYLTSGALELPLKKWANQFVLAAPVNTYPCKDGSVYTGVLLDAHWRALCEHIGCNDIVDLSGAQRLERRDELNDILATWCAQQSTNDVVETLGRLGLAATRVNTYAEAAKHEHVIERDMLQNTTLEDGSEIPLTGPPAKFSRTPTRIRAAAASLGQHNDEIYARLGYDADKIARLKSSGII